MAMVLILTLLSTGFSVHYIVDLKKKNDIKSDINYPYNIKTILIYKLGLIASKLTI